MSGTIRLGDTFGHLKIIECLGVIADGKKTKRNRYKGLCTCGDISTYSYSNLMATTRSVKNCKNCSFKKRSLKLEKTDPIEQMYNHDIVLRCRHSKKGVINNLLLDDFRDIVNKNCHYCNIEPTTVKRFLKNKYINLNIKANGVDRLDSSLGYLRENCVPCCSDCNKMKMDSSYNDFLKKISMIYKNRIKCQG